MKEENFSFALLRWFQENARVLPWRQSANPYHVWLSEIMLQQTRVVAVLDYYPRFLEKLPDISHLATCDEEVLMKLWQGLGYYSRARNMQKAAQQVMAEHGGEFPREYEKIRALAGIGDYTAGAIASTVYNLPYPAVDGNVFRVFSRLKGDGTDISTGEMKKKVSAWVLSEMPLDFTGLYNQALMELGATVCLPNGAPRCDICPVSGFCACFGSEKWRDYPVKPSKKPRKVERLSVFLLWHQGRIALRRRPEKGLLAGLWEFPHYPQEGDLPEFLGESRKIAEGKHIFTHILWEMVGYSLEISDISLCPEDWQWVSVQELAEKYALPSAFSWVLETLP